MSNLFGNFIPLLMYLSNENFTCPKEQIMHKEFILALNLLISSREGFVTGLGTLSVLVVQSEQHVMYRLMGGSKEAQANMEETDGERLL